MSVQHVRQALGSWDVELEAETPRKVLDLIDLDLYGFGHFVITPLHIPLHVVDGDDLFDHARYTGIYRTNNLSSRREGEPVKMQGAHLAALMGDEDGKGDIFEYGTDITARPFYNGLATSWITAVLSRSNGLTAGSTMTTASSPIRSGHMSAGDSARDLLMKGCALFRPPHQWRVNPNGTLDAGQQNTLWPSTTAPRVAFMPEEGGRDGALRGIEATIYRLDSDLEDWASSKIIDWGGEQVGSATEADDGIDNVPYVGFDGGEMVLTDYESDSSPRTAQGADNVAYNYLYKVSRTRRHLRISTEIFDVENYVEPGDTIYVFDPDQNLYNPAVQVHYRGRIIFPTSVRVEAIRWPIAQGMGVYLRYWTGSAFAWLDLTDWVVWEDSDAQLEIGDVYRTYPRRHRATDAF